MQIQGEDIGLRIEVPYGLKTASGNIRLSKSIQMIVPRKIEPLDSPSQKIIRAIGKSSLARAAFSQRSDMGSVVIAAPRPEEFPKVVEAVKAVLDSITTAGIRASEVTVLLADVLTKSSAQEDVLAQFRNALPTNTSIEFHNWKDGSTTSYVGTTPTGCTPIHINTKYLQADLKIAIGHSLPDMVHSITGVPYTIVPGIASNSTACKTRMKAMKESPSLLNARSSVAVDLMEGSSLPKPGIAMDFITDYSGNISSLVVGELGSVWQKNMERSKMVMEVDCSLRADVAIVSMGGSPWDRTLYDALEGLFVSTKVTREGALVILLAECGSGVGPESFERLMRSSTSAETARAEAQRHFMVGMEKVPIYWEMLATREFVIMSELDDETVKEVCHAIPAESLQAALAYAEKVQGIDATYAIIPYGKFTSPINESDSS
ncbi:DUF2088 domain-containing protein [Candidatus Thorarchaeota archaeon]|nr:MAG: DUF2088 domain-containing protein [Candidatus Thorarchaeota archaeon]